MSTQPELLIQGWGSAYSGRQSFLHNRLGGLQVLPPGADEWNYVKVGQCCIRFGFLRRAYLFSQCPGMPFAISAMRWRSSALASCTQIFTESCKSLYQLPLSSSPRPDLTSWVPIRRPPPKAQASFDRWSLVFFTRPGHSVPLAPLTEESTLIAEAAARAPESRYATSVTAGEWFRRRIQNRRVKNRRVSALPSCTTCRLFLVGSNVSREGA